MMVSLVNRLLRNLILLYILQRPHTISGQPLSAAFDDRESEDTNEIGDKFREGSREGKVVRNHFLFLPAGVAAISVEANQKV